MKHYVSTQVLALRHFRATQLPDGVAGSAGFAWAPQNPTGSTSFPGEAGELLERLAAAIRDSGSDATSEDPAAGACGGVWCGGDVEGGWLNLGWQSFRTWYVPPADTVAPQTTITSAPTGTVASRSASVAFVADEAGAGFECSLDDAPYTACTSPVALGGLADGPHVVRVRAVDAAGNVDASPAEAAWSVDGTPPETWLTSAPPATTTARSATFSFAASEAGSFECSLNGSAWSACVSPQSYASLKKGTWTFRVRAVDAVGNADATPAAHTWRIR
jgi:hypothetical protein